MQSIVNVSSDQLTLWIASFFWPFVRMLALVSTAPILGEKSVPRQIKVALSVLLAVVVAPTLGAMPQVPLVSSAGIWIVMQQVLIGVAMGFSMRAVFAIVQAAGDYVGLQMGLSFAAFFDPTSGGQTQVVARLLNLLALLIFLSVDAHLLLILTLVESFSVLPISGAGLSAAGWWVLVLAGGNIFTGGLMLALPIVATLLAINLAMGILNRASPQFSIFAVGFPITLLVGMAMLQLLMPYLAPFMEPRFAEGFATIGRALQAWAVR